MFGVVDGTTTTKFASRACAVHCISLPVVVDKVVVVVLKFPSVRRSPILNAVSGNKTPVMILLDTGVECSFIRIEEAQRLGVRVDKNTSQRPSMADGISSLHVLGETHINFLCHGNKLHMDAILVDTLASPIVAGMSFMEDNGIDINGRSRTITLPDSTSPKYDSPQVNNKPRLGRILIRSESKSSTWWPNEAVYLKPPKVQPGDVLLLDPRHDCDPSIARILKPTMAVVAEDNTVALFPNLNGPITAPRYSHLFNVSLSVPVDSPELQEVLMSPYKAPVVMATTPTEHPVDTVRIDPDNILPQQDKALLREITRRFPSVFKPDFKGYNGAMGPFQAVVNIGPSLPPQRKGRVPQYSRDKLVLLQEKLDQLEEAGIIAKPEMVGISVEYLNPSFLVTKPNGGHRLVTAFSEVAKYCKPQPSLMPDVNNTLRIISKWKYLIVTDLTSAFHQIPLSRKSQKFCGIVTPFKGVRVYQRCAMGMPGSETALEELMPRVLGDLLMENRVAKLADDLYCGGDTLTELADNWSQLLMALDKSSLRLSPAKTIICPRSTTILGWLWEQGTLAASPQTDNALATCLLPTTTTDLKSFVGSVKAIARVIPGCASLLSPLEDAIKNREPKTSLVWSDAATRAFQDVQEAVTCRVTIKLPTPSDELWIATDAAMRPTGIAANMYIKTKNGLTLAGCYSARLKIHQRLWLPCEVD